MIANQGSFFTSSSLFEKKKNTVQIKKGSVSC